jgi:hypothetical protein
MVPFLFRIIEYARDFHILFKTFGLMKRDEPKLCATFLERLLTNLTQNT